MYGIIAEDKSDVEVLKVIVKRLANNQSISMKGKGYHGCGEMLRKGSSQLKVFLKLGCQRFIICYDADRSSPCHRYDEAVAKIITPFGHKDKYCVLVPIQEIEAWILADLQAVTKIIPSWVPTKIYNHPESVNDPKEALEKLSRNTKKRPRYSHATHHVKIAEHLNLSRVKAKCKSFLPLENLVLKGEGNIK
ncbi:MAG: DUF4276 family protein [Mariprofundaceae bacterium]|nr:DUF4276 family protein [Mariprofundaceae bacterium]